MSQLLAVSWELPPIYGPRGTQVWRTLDALGRRGWRTTAIGMAPRRGGPHWPSADDAPSPTATDVVRVPSPEESLMLRLTGRLLPPLRRLPDPQRPWVGRAATAAIQAASGTAFNGLLTFAQPWSDHLVGLRVHRATRLPWVAHFSDPWVDSPYTDATSWTAARARRMEAAVVAEAAAIVFVTTETADLVMRKYPPAMREKAAVVPHGFVPGAPALPALRRPGPLRLVHTGRFYPGLRTPSALLQAVARLHARSPLTDVVELTFVGPNGDPFQAEAARLGIGALATFQDRVPREAADAIAADADVLLVIDAPSSGPSVFLPSKLIDYLAWRKPILGLTPACGASRSLLERLGCPAVAPDDVDAIASALDRLVQQSREGTLGVPPVFDAVAREYEIDATTGALERVLVGAFERAS